MEMQKGRVCPNPMCRFHNPEVAQDKKWYRPHGHYRCPGNPEKEIRRYRCIFCGRTFSETYFSRIYHLQRRDIDDIELLFEWCKGNSIQELANHFNCSIKAIQNRIQRMKSLAQRKEVILEIEHADGSSINLMR